jgi:hypothetical protein
MQAIEFTSPLPKSDRTGIQSNLGLMTGWHHIVGNEEVKLNQPSDLCMFPDEGHAS